MSNNIFECSAINLFPMTHYSQSPFQYQINNKAGIENLVKHTNRIMAYFIVEPVLYYGSEKSSISSSIEKIVKSETEGISNKGE
jgi:hypothetical protein